MGNKTEGRQEDIKIQREKMGKDGRRRNDHRFRKVITNQEWNQQ